MGVVCDSTAPEDTPLCYQPTCSERKPGRGSAKTGSSGGCSERLSPNDGSDTAYPSTTDQSTPAASVLTGAPVVEGLSDAADGG